MDIRIAGVALDPLTFDDDQLLGLRISLRAFDGEVGIGAFQLPDPTGDTNMKGHRELRIVQDDVYLLDGFLGDQTRTASRPLHPERTHLLTTADANLLLLSFRVVESRPAETVEERWLYFLGAYRPTWTTDWVLDTDPVTLPAKVYDTADGFAPLIADTVELTGKTVFVHDLVEGGRCMHVHRFTEGHSALLSVSDVLGDWDQIDVFPPVKYASRTHSPVDLRNRIYATDQAGREALVFDQDSIDAHNVDGMSHDARIEFEAGSLAELTMKAQQYLTEHKLEAQTYRIGLQRLDSTAMAKWRVGDLLDVTSDILGLPNVGSPHRISHADITVTRDANGRPLAGLWDVDMELGAPIRARRHVPKPGPPSPFIPTPALAWSCTMDAPGGDCTDEDPTVSVDLPGGHNATIVYEFEVHGSLDPVGWCNGDILVRVNGGGLQELDIMSVGNAGLGIGAGVSEDNLCWNAGDQTYCSTEDLVAAGFTQPSTGVAAPISGLPWTLTVAGIQHLTVGFAQWEVASTLTVRLVRILDATTGLPVWPS